MKGSVTYQKGRGRWAVSWYHKKPYLITRYKGEFMYHRKIAEKCLAMIQSDYENYLSGLSAFRMEKYTGKNWTDVIDYFEQWLMVKEQKKPATIKGYRSYYKNWIKPFFEKNPVMLHDIQLDTLNALLKSITLSGKGKYNVINCFHAFMDYAWRSRRINEMPAFPKKGDFGIVEPSIKWLPEYRQMAVIEAVPETDRPIFLWLKYHLRRPAEACSLRKEDYDIINKVFTIRRSVSARKVVESTKTGVEHVIPCHDDFIEIADRLAGEPGIYFFVNPTSKHPGGRYSNTVLNTRWKTACKKVGESIDMYSGLKHSSCSQYVNEKGMAISDLQVLTDHARIDSVKRYAKAGVSRKRDLMRLKVVGGKKRKRKGE